MPVSVTPDGRGQYPPSVLRIVYFCHPGQLICPKGHLMHGVSVPPRGMALHTCQFRRSGREKRCEERVLAIWTPVPNRCVVLRIYPDEYAAVVDGKEIDELITDMGLHADFVAREMGP